MNQEQLSESELKAIRALLEQDKRVTWLWHNIGQAIKWGIVVGGALAVIWTNLHKWAVYIAGLPK